MGCTDIFRVNEPAAVGSAAEAPDMPVLVDTRGFGRGVHGMSVQFVGVIERELFVDLDVTGGEEGNEVQALVDVVYEARDN